jgi:hypothetical protein
VLEGERLEAEEKLLSLFEEHTVVIRRGKARNKTEFGRKVWLSEVDGGIVSGFSILEGNSGDQAQLKPSLEDHLCACSTSLPNWWRRTATYTPKTTSGWQKGSV